MCGSDVTLFEVVISCLVHLLALGSWLEGCLSPMDHLTYSSLMIGMLAHFLRECISSRPL
jgi:hypothetical protein